MELSRFHKFLGIDVRSEKGLTGAGSHRGCTGAKVAQLVALTLHTKFLRLVCRVSHLYELSKSCAVRDVAKLNLGCVILIQNYVLGAIMYIWGSETASRLHDRRI